MHRSILLVVCLCLLMAGTTATAETTPETQVEAPQTYYPDEYDLTSDETLWEHGAYFRLLFGAGRFRINKSDLPSHDVYATSPANDLALGLHLGARFRQGYTFGISTTRISDDVITSEVGSDRSTRWRRTRNVETLYAGYRLLEWEHDDASISSLSASVAAGFMSYEIRQRGLGHGKRHYGRAYGLHVFYDYLYNDYVGFTAGFEGFHGYLNNTDTDQDFGSQSATPPPEVAISNKSFVRLYSVTIGLFVNFDIDLSTPME